MAPGMTLRRARGTALIGRNTHTRLGAELCTPVPIIGPTNWLVHIGKLRGFNYLAALAKPRIPSGGGVGSIRDSLFQKKHGLAVPAFSFLPRPSFFSCSFFFFFFSSSFFLACSFFFLCGLSGS